MRAAWGLAPVLIIVAVSGCVGSVASDEPTPTQSAVIEPAAVDPNSDLGAVQGHVMTDEGLPVAGATVGLRETAYLGQSDANGFFQLLDLPPGEYTLDVVALGYAAKARNVAVQAGEATEVTITLMAVAVADELYAEIFHFVGIFECALGTDAWISMCSWPYTAAIGTLAEGTCVNASTCTPKIINLTNYGAPRDIHSNTFRFNMTVKPGVGQMVAELVWQSSSAAATRLLLMIMCGDYDPFWDECYGKIRYGPGNGVTGPSPIKSVIDGKEFVDKGKGKGKYDLTKNDHVWVMNYVGLPFETAQVALNQKYEVWDTVFYNGVGPEDYSILPDS